MLKLLAVWLWWGRKVFGQNSQSLRTFSLFPWVLRFLPSILSYSKPDIEWMWAILFQYFHCILSFSSTSVAKSMKMLPSTFPSRRSDHSTVCPRYKVYSFILPEEDWPCKWDFVKSSLYVWTIIPSRLNKVWLFFASIDLISESHCTLRSCCVRSSHAISEVSGFKRRRRRRRRRRKEKSHFIAVRPRKRERGTAIFWHAQRHNSWSSSRRFWTRYRLLMINLEVRKHLVTHVKAKFGRLDIGFAH